MIDHTFVLFVTDLDASWRAKLLYCVAGFVPTDKKERWQQFSTEIHQVPMRIIDWFFMMFITNVQIIITNDRDSISIKYCLEALLSIF